MFVVIGVCTVFTDDSVADVAVEGITTSEPEKEVTMGGWNRINYSIYPSNATNRSVIVTSDDPTVAEPDDDNNWIRVHYKVGTANITITTVDGNYSCIIKVIVISEYYYHFYSEGSEVATILYDGVTASYPDIPGVIGWSKSESYPRLEYLPGEIMEYGYSDKFYAVHAEQGKTYSVSVSDSDCDRKIPALKKAIEKGQSVEVDGRSMKGSLYKKLLDAGIPVCFRDHGNYKLYLLGWPYGDDDMINTNHASSLTNPDSITCDENGFDGRTVKVKFVGNPEELAEGQWAIYNGNYSVNTVEEDGRQTAIFDYSGHLEGKQISSAWGRYGSVIALGALMILISALRVKYYYKKYEPETEEVVAEEDSV